jgi:hypothetical protein
MFTLIYGATPPHPVYGTYTYASRADQHHLTRPLVHLIVGNRLTQYQGPAAAFGAISDATANVLYTAHQNFPDRFSAPGTPVTNVRQFRDAYSIALRDFNTAGVVAAHTGTPLSQLRDGYYPVHAAQVQVNAARARECTEAIDDVVDRL